MPMCMFYVTVSLGHLNLNNMLALLPCTEVHCVHCTCDPELVIALTFVCGATIHYYCCYIGSWPTG